MPNRDLTTWTFADKVTSLGEGCGDQVVIDASSAAGRAGVRIFSNGPGHLFVELFTEADIAIMVETHPDSDGTATYPYN